MPPDFADDLLREALRCYPVQCNTAACIACRVVVQEELKEIYEQLLNVGDHSTWRPVEVMNLESLKTWARWHRIITVGQMSSIEKIQGRVNRSAHGPTGDMRRQLRRRTAANLANLWRYGPTNRMPANKSRQQHQFFIP
jgi:hypothetical protein